MTNDNKESTAHGDMRERVARLEVRVDNIEDLAKSVDEKLDSNTQVLTRIETRLGNSHNSSWSNRKVAAAGVGGVTGLGGISAVVLYALQKVIG